MVPALWRAYNQLKINVLALPTWRKPVGEGAKRTRGFNAEDVPLDARPTDDAPPGKELLEESVIGNLLRCYGRWKTIVKQRAPYNPA